MSKLEVVKKVKNGILYHDASGVPHIRLDNVRLSYPFVGTPAEDEDDNGNKQKKWRIVAMLPKATHKELKALIKEEIEKLIATAQKTDPKIKVPTSHWCLTDGDQKEDENMAGHFLISASDGKFRPKARDARGVIIDDIDKIDETFYGGCWGNVLIRLWYFNGKSKKNPTKPLAKRIVAGFVGVQFARNDEPFGSGHVDDEDAWESVEGAGGDEDPDDDGEI
ncbi:hypothetical protein D3C87_959380 [compost metagenome]